MRNTRHKQKDKLNVVTGKNQNKLSIKKQRETESEEGKGLPITGHEGPEGEQMYS